MSTVGAYEAKTHLASLLERVRKGERITITKNGVPVAVLSPPDVQVPDVRSSIARIRESRRGRRLEGQDIRSMIEEGRL
jgi:prevent-host-death family protein